VKATNEQIEVCERLFRGPLSVVTGPAGTGKTTVIEALVRAVWKSEGEGASILVLAPTGKAADRAREVFEEASLAGVETVTIHSFLASNGWLNDRGLYPLLDTGQSSPQWGSIWAINPISTPPSVSLAAG